MPKKAAELVGGIDIGGTKLHAVVADQQGRVLGRARKKSKAERGFAPLMRRAAEVLGDACRTAGVKRPRLAAVGVGAPSPVLPDGTAVRAPNLGWENVPLVETLARALKLPVHAANDCDAGTFGELVFGAARGASTAIGLFMGTGLGGGIVIDGKLVTGANHKAAELGHMVVVVGGRRCGCGNRGCLEAYASKAGMLRRIRHHVLCEGHQTLLGELLDGDFSAIRSSVLAEAYGAEDPLTVETLHEAADVLGAAVGSLLTMLGPEVVVLGGGVLEQLGRALLPRIESAAARSTFPRSAFGDSELRLSRLGDDAVALGAVALALRRTGDGR